MTDLSHVFVGILKKEGGERTLAFSKKHKSEMLDQYGDWLNRSQAVFLLEYKKMTMKDIDTLRAKARDVNAELHIVKKHALRSRFGQSGDR